VRFSGVLRVPALGVEIPVEVDLEPVEVPKAADELLDEAGARARLHCSSGRSSASGTSDASPTRNHRRESSFTASRTCASTRRTPAAVPSPGSWADVMRQVTDLPVAELLATLGSRGRTSRAGSTRALLVEAIPRTRRAVIAEELLEREGRARERTRRQPCALRRGPPEAGGSGEPCGRLRRLRPEALACRGSRLPRPPGPPERGRDLFALRRLRARSALHDPARRAAVAEAVEMRLGLTEGKRHDAATERLTELLRSRFVGTVGYTERFLHETATSAAWSEDR